MALVKVIEVLAQSDKSWEDAAKQAVDEASKTLRNLRTLYVKDFQMVLKEGRPQYRLDAKISFEVEPVEKREEAVAETARFKKNAH